MCKKALSNRLAEKDRKPGAGRLNVFEPAESSMLEMEEPENNGQLHSIAKAPTYL